MNKTLQLAAGLMLGGFVALSSARGQAIYATPYTFVTIAGTALNNGFADGTNGAAQFGYPAGVALDTNGNLYAVDNLNNNIRKVTPVGTNWVVTTIAGSGGDENIDGTNQNAQFNGPNSIALDTAGNLYVADTLNCNLRKVTPIGTNWVVSTIAGTTNFGSADGTNNAASFSFPYGVAVDASGIVYVADTYNQTIRRVALAGTNWVVTTIAGSTGVRDSVDGTNQGAGFSFPTGIAVDSADNLYVADNGSGTIREIVSQGTNWIVTTIAGSPGGSSDVDGTNADAQFNAPSGITVDASGNVYVADSGDNVIRKITPVGTNWVTTTLAGDPNGDAGYTNGTGANVLFNNPTGVAVDSAGKVYVADFNNSVIRAGIVAAVPNLAISLAAGNSVVISWPGPGGTLETNADLTTANWGVYGGAVTSSNGTNSVTLPPSGGSLYFRLTN